MKKTDRIINAVAFVAIAAMIVGLMLAIWIGVTGIRIAASAALVFAADCLVHFAARAAEKRTGEENNG